MSGEMHRVEIEVGAQFFALLQDEADRLGVGVEQIVTRAVAAWLGDMHESAPIIASQIAAKGSK